MAALEAELRGLKDLVPKLACVLPHKQVVS